MTEDMGTHQVARSKTIVVSILLIAVVGMCVYQLLWGPLSREQDSSIHENQAHITVPARNIDDAYGPIHNVSTMYKYYQPMNLKDINFPIERLQEEKGKFFPLSWDDEAWTKECPKSHKKHTAYDSIPPELRGDSPTYNDTLESILQLPAWTTDEINSLPFVAEYQCIERLVKQGKLPQRYAVYSYKDWSGWGNRLRGLTTVFHFALLTRRLFLVDHTCVHELFDPPHGMTTGKDGLSWSNHKDIISTIDSGGGFPITSLHPVRADGTVDRSMSWEQTLATSRNLTELSSHPILFHGDGTEVDRLLGTNPKYTPHIRRLFGTISRWARTGMITRYLLQNPSERLRTKAREFMESIPLDPEKPFAVIQLRTFVDVINANPNMPFFFDCAKKVLEKHKTEMQTLNMPVYFTSDKESARDAAQKALALPEGKFLTRPGSSVHSSHTGDCANAGILDWYLLGHARVLVTTGTTYGIFATGRTGYTSSVYRADIWSQPQVCSPLRNSSVILPFDVFY